MGNLIENLHQKVLSLFKKGVSEQVDFKADLPEFVSQECLALGVLLWVVAQSDGRFLPKERIRIEQILSAYGKLDKSHLAYVLGAVKVAEAERIDLHQFTHQVCEGLSYGERIHVLENLFRVACIDGDLAHEEHEMIRKISGLFKVDHEEFIEAKVKIKKEFGLVTTD